MTEIHRIDSFEIEIEDIFTEEHIGEFSGKNAGIVFIEVY